LEQFKEREGHCNVPNRHKEEGTNLGIWVTTQRQAKNAGKLDVTREQRLEKFGIVWDAHGDQWERMFALLEQFKDREGHCNVPVSHKEEGVNLGLWLSKQREAKKAGKLDVTRERRLEKFGIVWDALGDQWERMFGLLEQFKDREGHCNVQHSHKEEGENLGFWVLTQRQAKNAGKLDVTRERRLEKFGVVWDILDDQWERMFALLGQFKEREGHCNVQDNHKEEDTNLGRWVRSQRAAKKAGTLDVTRERHLERFGVVWDRKNIDK
jgi:hypothetical protein